MSALPVPIRRKPSSASSSGPFLPLPPQPAEPRVGVFLFSLGGKSPGCCAGPAVPVLEPQVHRKSAHLSADPHSSSPAMLSRCENNDLNSQGWKIMI